MAEEEKIVPFYNLKAKDGSGKDISVRATDALALRQWMHEQESGASVFRINIDEMKDKSISYLQAKIYSGAWRELISYLDDILGIKKDEPEVEDVEPKTEVVEPEKKAEVVEVKKENPPDVDFVEDKPLDQPDKEITI